MRNILVLTKMNFKILLRNKGFWFFLLIIPLVSLLLLNMREDSSTKRILESKNQVVEIPNIDEKVIYMTLGIKYPVKVYDSSHSELTDLLLQQLTDTGLTEVFRFRCDDMQEADILESIEDDTYFDRIGTVLYFTEDFEEKLLDGDPLSALQVFTAKEDERTELFDESLNSTLCEFNQAVSLGEGNSTQVKKLIEERNDKTPKKEIVVLKNTDTLELTERQIKKEEHFGYAMAIVSLGFLFCGIFIAYTVMEERQNNVFRRIMLSKAGELQYIFSKMIIAFLIALMQTGILGLGIQLIVHADFGLSTGTYLFLMFSLGLIFIFLGLCVGILFKNIIDACYGTFFVWILSSLLSGIFFPLSSRASGSIVTKLAEFMPQKWMLKAVEMIMTGDNSAYMMCFVVTAAYVLLCLSIGAVGLKTKREE